MTEIRPVAYGSDEYQATVDLRRRVLRSPLGLDFASEQLDAEIDDVHLAYLEGGRVLACLVLSQVDPGVLRMRQVAVEEALQRRGLGLALVEAAEIAAKEGGFSKMTLHAREAAIPFYLRLGYQIVGERFVEVGLPHRAMEKRFCV